MILVAIFLSGVALIGLAGRLLGEPETHDDSSALDALLFLLCLISVVRRHKSDEENDS